MLILKGVYSFDVDSELLGYDVDIPRYRMSSVFFSVYSGEDDEGRRPNK